MKQLEKLTFNEMPVSSRKRPFVGFDSLREAGQDILMVNELTKSIGDEKLLNKISFSLKKGDKVILLGKNDLAKTTLLEILAEELQADSGSYSWGVTTTRSYFPADNTKYFESEPLTLVDWLRQYSTQKEETFIRGFLGKMLFGGNEAMKMSNVLSGGEKVRCMLAKMMLSGANVLLLDGPTNHLDIESITSVNEGLVRFKGTAIFTCHDHEFIQTTANRIIELSDTGTIAEDRYITYDEYLELKRKKETSH